MTHEGVGPPHREAEVKTKSGLAHEEFEAFCARAWAARTEEERNGYSAQLDKVAPKYRAPFIAGMATLSKEELDKLLPKIEAREREHAEVAARAQAKAAAVPTPTAMPEAVVDEQATEVPEVTVPPAEGTPDAAATALEDVTARIWATFSDEQRGGLPADWTALDEEMRAHLIDRCGQWSADDRWRMLNPPDRTPAPFCVTPIDAERFDAGWRRLLIADYRNAGLTTLADAMEKDPSFGGAELETFIALVFEECGVEGGYNVSLGDVVNFTARNADEIRERVSMGGEAYVSMQTHDFAERPVSQVAVAAPIDSVETSPLPPSTVLRHEDGELFAVWFLSETIDLQTVTVPEELTKRAPLPGVGLWSIAKADLTRAYTYEELKTALVPEPTPHTNGAVRYGTVDPALLARKVSVGGSLMGQSTAPGRWKNREYTIAQLIAKLERHQVGDKDGDCLMQGPVIEGKRQASAVPRLELLIIDLDTGQSIDEMRERLQQLGYFAVIYSTHSYGKPITQIKKDVLIKYFDGEVNPSIDQVCAYLQKVKRYQPEILDGAELLKDAHEAGGIMMVVKHRPMPKFRVVLLLDKPFVIAERGGLEQEARKEWRERYFGASKLIGAYCDQSCTDPSRLFFLPRHPKTATEWRVEVIAGKPLDIETCPRVTAEDLRREGMDPFAKVADRGKEYRTHGIKRFFKHYADRFEVETFLLDMDPDGDRGARSSGSGRTHRCPNDDAHSNAGDENDRGFFCVNATESDKGGAVAHCMHASCVDLDRIDYVDMICARVGITDAEELKKWVPEIDDEGGAGA